MKTQEKRFGLFRSAQLRTAYGLMVFYVACAVLFLLYKLGMGLVVFFDFQSGKYIQQSLTLNDFEQYGVEQIDDMTMINATDDTQLWLTGNLYNLYIDCSFSYDPGEFIVFYAFGENDGFSPKRCVRGRLMDGYYRFDFPAGTKKIRMDTGIHPSITVSFREILVNKETFNTVMRFSTEDLFYLLIVPGILYALWDLAAKLPWVKRRRRAPAPAAQSGFCARGM